MTAKQKILKLMSRRFRTHAGHCIKELGLNPNTARGRLSELESEGLIEMVHRGTPGRSNEYGEYVLTSWGREEANTLPDLVTLKKGPYIKTNPPRLMAL